MVQMVHCLKILSIYKPLPYLSYVFFLLKFKDNKHLCPLYTTSLLQEHKYSIEMLNVLSNCGIKNNRKIWK